MVKPHHHDNKPVMRVRRMPPIAGSGNAGKPQIRYKKSLKRNQGYPEEDNAWLKKITPGQPRCIRPCIADKALPVTDGQHRLSVHSINASRVIHRNDNRRRGP